MLHWRVLPAPRKSAAFDRPTGLIGVAAVVAGIIVRAGPLPPARGLLRGRAASWCARPGILAAMAGTLALSSVNCLGAAAPKMAAIALLPVQVPAARSPAPADRKPALSGRIAARLPGV